MGLFGSSGDGGAAKQEQARQSNIKRGMQDIDQQFSRFDDKFYNQAGTDYTKAVTPRLYSDFQNTKNNLAYALARGGNSNSSAAIGRTTSLNNQLAENQSTIANQAQDRSNQLRTNVNNQRGQVVNQLEASADPQAANESALAATASIRAPSVIQPLGNLFADWSQQYLNSTAKPPQTDNVWSQLANQGYGQAGGAAGSSYMVN